MKNEKELLRKIVYGLNQIPRASFTDIDGNRSDTYKLAAEIDKLFRKPDNRIENYFDVGDIDSKHLSKGFIKAIDGFATYRDQILKEHIFSPESILEEVSDLQEGEDEYLLPEYVEELRRIKAELDVDGFSYFRIVYH